MADGGITLSDELANRMLAAIRWTERQRGLGGTQHRGRLDGGDPFERVKLDATLNKGSSALGTIMTGSSSAGWAAGTKQVTVYEDDMLAVGESIASAVEIHVKWMHGDWVLDDVPCASID